MNYQNNYNQQPQNDGVYDWDSEIQQESSFVLLPAGDYRFTIEKFERARYNGGEKIPPCNKAIITFRVYAPDGTSTLIQENYLLYQSMEWKLSEFFAAIGLKKKGEPVRMKWTSELIGKSGVCKVYVDNYKKKTDAEGEKTGYSNKIDKLYPAYDQPALQPPAQPAPQQTALPPARNWTAGSFN